MFVHGEIADLCDFVIAHVEVIEMKGGFFRVKDCNQFVVGGSNLH